MPIAKHPPPIIAHIMKIGVQGTQPTFSSRSTDRNRLRRHSISAARAASSQNAAPTAVIRIASLASAHWVKKSGMARPI